METAHEEEGNSAQTAQSAAEPAKPEGSQDAGEQGDKGDSGQGQNRHEDGGQEAAGSDSRATGTSQAGDGGRLMALGGHYNHSMSCHE